MNGEIGADFYHRSYSLDTTYPGIIVHGIRHANWGLGWTIRGHVKQAYRHAYIPWSCQVTVVDHTRTIHPASSLSRTHQAHVRKPCGEYSKPMHGNVLFLRLGYWAPPVGPVGPPR
ncbi:hypothetical protein VNO77_26933 [Canavalia gladiata]|uniref:Uncharacterized protein n=1 Tax=Canavalia gladiata TaxID=3824 RepID=A0AAN9KTW6_CANGL